MSETFARSFDRGSMARMNVTPGDPNRTFQPERSDPPCPEEATDSGNDGSGLKAASSCTAASPGAPRTQHEPQHVAAWLNLSHELHTPAHAILGHVELLLAGSAGPLSSEMRISLGDIQRAAIQLSAQITDVVKRAEALPFPGTNRSTPTPDRTPQGSP